jgi:hypothetical protein
MHRRNGIEAYALGFHAQTIKINLGSVWVGVQVNLSSNSGVIHLSASHMQTSDLPGELARN